MRAKFQDNISPLDERYRKETEEVRKIFSNFALIKFRLQVEILWLIEFLTNTKIEVKSEEIQKMKSIFIEFSREDYASILEIENQTKHDIKAIEYFIAQQLEDMRLQKFSPYIHFGLTSEDTDTSAYALALKEGKETFLEQVQQLTKKLTELAKKNSKQAILSLTHGQAATPSTFGKEVVNFLKRIQVQTQALRNHKLSTKIACSTGNYQALHHTYPELDWPSIVENMFSQLNLATEHYNTQIIPKENWLTQLFHTNAINLILVDFSRDIWGYIQRGIITQLKVDNEVGSSTMPHKINPINFENAEGNLLLANKLFEFFNSKLPISRFQRDLSDKTSLRNLGIFYGYSTLAIQSLIKGLNKIQFNKQLAKSELTSHPEVLTELIQMVLRKHQVTNAYEQLKDFSRGCQTSKSDLNQFILTLDIPDAVKQELQELNPQKYTGLAVKLCEQYFEEQKNTQ